MIVPRYAIALEKSDLLVVSRGRDRQIGLYILNFNFSRLEQVAYDGGELGRGASY